MKLVRTERFKKAWKELNKDEKKQAIKGLESLARNIQYPALGVKKMQGVHDIWEARISRSIRLTFEIHHDFFILRNIGKHDATLRKP